MKCVFNFIIRRALRKITETTTLLFYTSLNTGYYKYPIRKILLNSKCLKIISE